MATRSRKLRGGLYEHPKTGVLWCRFWIAGREYRRSCKTRDPKAAAIEARRLRVEAEQAKEADPAERARGAAAIEELSVEDLLEHRRRGVTDLHLHRLENKWVVTLRTLPRGIQAGDIDYDLLRTYEGRRREQGARGQTIVRELQCIKRALKIALRRGLIAALTAH